MDKIHDIIYLIDGNFDGDPCRLWCEDPAPEIGQNPEDAIKYVSAARVEELIGLYEGVVSPMAAVFVKDLRALLGEC